MEKIIHIHNGFLIIDGVLRVHSNVVIKPFFLDGYRIVDHRKEVKDA